MIHDINHEALYNEFDYSNILRIELALKTIKTLKQQALNGNSTAHVIVIDIENTITKLAEIQERCINLYYYQGYTQCETSRKLNVSQREVSRILTASHLQIMKILNNVDGE